MSKMVSFFTWSLIEEKLKEILIFAGEFIRDLVALESGGSGGVVWRIRANATKLVCAVGSRNGTEETKLLVLDFDAVDSKWISRISWFYQKWVFNPFPPFFNIMSDLNWKRTFFSAATICSPWVHSVLFSLILGPLSAQFICLDFICNARENSRITV